MSEFQDLADNYKRCYGKNKLTFGSKPVLIVIDCVKAYHDPKSPLYAPDRFEVALKSIHNLIAKCRAVGIPVVFSSVIFETPASGGKWYMEKLPNVLCCYDAGNPFREFAEGVVPRKDEVVVMKQFSSSFFGTSLASVLASMGCDSTILCGYSTSGCVRATALDAMQHGYSPFVVREACGDRHQAVNDNNLFDMDQKFAEVILEEEIMAMIDGIKKA
ncbi:Maleamate amidohydrolase [Lachnellula subtilissima]|uniref:Maleamate amidohydrolase n=1 Tax=Lachnellula subtilissima TaxID=602034 RepID=A0A8H8RQN1_9HELO|nr:Maleamate amidohydrolase [Lachnellula subtilissima]